MTNQDPNAGGQTSIDQPAAHEVPSEPLGERPAGAPNPGLTQPGDAEVARKAPAPAPKAPDTK